MTQIRLLKQRWKPGSIVQIDLEDGTYAFGLVLDSPQIAFYEYFIKKQNVPVEIEIIKKQKTAFIIYVYRNCVNRFWPIIGKVKYDPNLYKIGDSYVHDTINKTYTIWKENNEKILSIWEECQDLEYASVWECGSVEQRLRDHFANRPCWYLENKKPDWKFIPIKKFYAQYGYDFTFLNDSV